MPRVLEASVDASGVSLLGLRLALAFPIHSVLVDGLIVIVPVWIVVRFRLTFFTPVPCPDSRWYFDGKSTYSGQACICARDESSQFCLFQLLGVRDVVSGRVLIMSS
jgi:hypothetical protein